MKKLVVFMLVIALAGSLFANSDFMIQTETKTALESHKGMVPPVQRERDVPEYEFEIAPTALATSFYDYMPGSYASLPLRILSDGNAYAAFHAQETAAVNRRVYYSFIEAGGSSSTFTISTDNLWEGYAGIDVDPVTDDPFVSWHVEIDAAQAGLEVVTSYDMYHVQGAGYWKAPFITISADIPTPYADDEFIWPYTYVGPSPIDGKRRVYVTSNNSVGHGPEGNPAENVLLAYADFDGNDILAQSELDWTYQTIETLDNWNAGNPDTRPFKALAVSDTDGKLAYIGYNTQDEFFIIYNDNYGEGDWTTVTQDGAFPIDHPMNEDGTPAFPDEAGAAQDLHFGRINDGHFNAHFNQDSNTLRMAGAMGLQAPEDSYYPFIIFPYTFSFDFDTDQFSFQAMETEINENANNPEYVWQENEVYLPWDTDNDGEIDEYYDDGSVAFFSGWPIYFHDNDTAFHENAFYVVNGDGGRVVALWQDGLRNKYAQDGIEGYEEYIEVADIMISISNDHGATWSDAIIMNNMDTPELADMKPAYVYPGDVIEDLGDGHGRLHLMFYDDNSFGSSVHGFGNADGGTQMYAALDIDFGDVINNADNNAVAPVLGTLAQNYPNPFNPTTTISYNLQTAGDVSLEVYNTKGQLIDTLVDENQTAGTHNVVWNGTDARGDELTSGVYFYKIKSGKFTSTKKMILLK